METLQIFGVRADTPFSSYLHDLKDVVAGTIEKVGTLKPSPDPAIELVRMRMAQQYLMLMPITTPGKLAI